MTAEEPIDMRRKLDSADYSKIRLYLNMNWTKRQIASVYHISTKFVSKIEDGVFTFAEDGSTKFVLAPDGPREYYFNAPAQFLCSGCQMGYGSLSGLAVHYAIYTSGNTKELDCMNFMPMVSTT
jgi:hypothetical protein